MQGLFDKRTTGVLFAHNIGLELTLWSLGVWALSGEKSWRRVFTVPFFAILAETKVGRMAGAPVIDLSELPKGFKLPPQAMMFAGVPSRILNIRLWSPSIAPADAKAS